jgi:signal transduction histidine kinase
MAEAGPQEGAIIALRTRTLCWLGVGLLPFGTWTDALAFPGLSAGPIWVPHGVAFAFCALTLLLLRWPIGQRHARAISVGFVVGATLALIAKIRMTGGIESVHLPSIWMALILCGIVLPWGWRLMAAVAAVVSGALLISELGTHQISRIDLPRVFVTLFSAASGVVAAALSQRGRARAAAQTAVLVEQGERLAMSVDQAQAAHRQLENEVSARGRRDALLRGAVADGLSALDRPLAQLAEAANARDFARVVEVAGELRSSSARLAREFVGAMNAGTAPSSSAGQTLPTAKASTGQVARILVADDNPVMRSLIQQVLEVDYHVTTIGDGAAALDYLREHRVDLMVTDIMMPGLDGFEVLQHIRSSPELAQLPVILVTGKADAQDAVEGLARGANDYIQKPFHPAVLKARVSNQLAAIEVRERAIAQRGEDRLQILGAGLAHEVRNPLNGILNSVHPLRAGSSPEDTELLDVVESCAHRIARLCDDMLTLARSRNLPLTPWSLAPSIRRVVADLAGNFPCVSITLDVAEEVTLLSHGGGLNQVVFNLLDNALRACAPKGQVSISTVLNSKWVEILVTDDGAGIEPELLDRIFDPFFTTRPPGEGTGLGLTICRDILGRHGGHLDLVSNPERGTIARVKLELPSREFIEAVASD